MLSPLRAGVYAVGAVGFPLEENPVGCVLRQDRRAAAQQVYMPASRSVRYSMAAEATMASAMPTAASPVNSSAMAVRPLPIR